MSSDINTAIPPLGTPTTAGVRANFAAAKAEIEELQTANGWADYQDTATTTTPLTIVSGTWKKLTNNAAGAQTRTDMLPSLVTSLWNTTNNQLDFSQLPLNSTIDIRMDFSVTVASANTVMDVSAFCAIGSVSAFELPLLTSKFFSTAGTYKVTIQGSMYIGSSDVKSFPAELRLKMNSAGSVVVNGWFIKAQKKTT